MTFRISRAHASTGPVRRWALVFLAAAAVVAASSIVRGLHAQFVPFGDPGFEGRVGMVLVRTGFVGLAMVIVGLALLIGPLRPRIGRVGGPLAVILAGASLLTSGVGIATHYDDARPWGRLEGALDQVHLPAALRLVDEEHIEMQSPDRAPIVRRTWAVPPTQGRDETCAQVKEALTPLEGGTPLEINPGRCDLFVDRTNEELSVWLDTDRDPDTLPTPAQLRGQTRFVVIEVVAL